MAPIHRKQCREISLFMARDSEQSMTRTGKKMGRPLKNPPKDAAEHIRAYAADGFSVLGVAAKLGTSQDTLRKWFERFPELSQAFEQGREEERHILHNKLFRLATEQDHASSAMFLLKARHGYREGDQSEQGNKVSITFTLPGALPLSEFKGQVIEHSQPRALPDSRGNNDE